MPRHELASSLELEQDIPSQRREGRFERVEWEALAVIVAAGFAGLLGGGPAAHRTATTEDNAVTLSYARIARQGAPALLTLGIPGGDDSLVQFSIDQRYLATVNLGEVVPAPASSSHTSASVSVMLQRTDPATPMQIDVAIQPL